MNKRIPYELLYDQKIHNPLAEALAESAYTEEEIAAKMDIDRSTLSLWKKKYPKFLEAIRRGKEVPNQKVVKKLYERAIGYEYEETETIINAQSKEIQRVKRTKKHMPPDVPAIRYWLNNRWKGEWGDRKAIDLTDNTDYALHRKKIDKIFAEVKAEMDKEDED